MFPASERGLAMTLFAAAPFMGPVLGPIVGGFVSLSCIMILERNETNLISGWNDRWLALG